MRTIGFPSPSASASSSRDAAKVTSMKLQTLRSSSVNGRPVADWLDSKAITTAFLVLWQGRRPDELVRTSIGNLNSLMLR